MMPLLSDSQQRRLVGVLGLLSSDQVGERAAAALLASRLLKSAGLTWEQLVRQSEVAQVARPSGTAPASRSDFGNDMLLCNRHLRMLTEWEQRFCLSVARVGQRSAKQVSTLRKIAAALRARGLV